MAYALLAGMLFSATINTRADDLLAELKQLPDRVVYETWRENNWELFSTRADGSDPINLTQTESVDELYPHVSPNGAKICFTVDEGPAAARVRNVYVMNLDGSGRTLVARNARQACWKADGSAIAYLGGEFDEYCIKDFATRGIFVYDLATGTRWEHPNKELYHLYNLCWSPDGKWFFATVHGGMGYRHTILAIEADGPGVFDLEIPGCRPDVGSDGRRIAWGPSDWVLRVGDLDFSGLAPKVINSRDVVTSEEPMKIYHIDFSPDGRYVAYSRGPARKVLGNIPEIVGAKAKDWNIWVADAQAANRSVQITSDGACNKEPDWMPGEKKQ
jgi:Tol biopolymer transport system component